MTVSLTQRYKIVSPNTIMLWVYKSSLYNRALKVKWTKQWNREKVKSITFMVRSLWKTCFHFRKTEFQFNSHNTYAMPGLKENIFYRSLCHLSKFFEHQVESMLFACLLISTRWDEQKCSYVVQIDDFKAVRIFFFTFHFNSMYSPL